jgi:hypothetical protein
MEGKNMSMENNKIDEKALDQVNGGVILQRNDGSLQVHRDSDGDLKAYGSRNKDTMTSTAFFLGQSTEIIDEKEFQKRYPGVSMNPEDYK